MIVTAMPLGAFEFKATAAVIDEIFVNETWNASWDSNVEMKNAYLTVTQSGYYDLKVTDNLQNSELSFRFRDFDADDSQYGLWYNPVVYGNTGYDSYSYTYTEEKIYLIQGHTYELSLVYSEYDDYYDDYVYQSANVSVLITKLDYTPIKLTLGSSKNLPIDSGSREWLELHTTASGDYLFETNQFETCRLRIYEKNSGIAIASTYFDSSLAYIVRLKSNTEYVIETYGYAESSILVKIKASKSSYNLSKIEIYDQNGEIILPDNGYIYDDYESSFYSSDIRSFDYKITYSNGTSKVYDYYDLLGIGIVLDDILYKGAVYTYEDECFFKNGNQPVTIKYNSYYESSSYIYITSFVEWCADLNPMTNYEYGTITYEDEDVKTYYWRLMPDENNVYEFYAYNWEDLSYSNFTIFDSNGKIVSRNDEGWILEGGKEYCLRVSYQYDDYCYDDVDFCFEPYREHTHTYSYVCDTNCNVCNFKRTTTHKYSNSCDTTCNICGATRKITHKYTKKTTVKATLSRNGYVLTECSVCGKDYSKSYIYYPKTIKLSGTSFTYTGKAITPKITVKNSAGKTISSRYYTVTYARGRKNVGKYAVTIKFKGNYSGTKTLYFTITPPKTTVSKLTAGKKSITVNVTKKSSQVTGYQIQYATNKRFSGAKTKTISSYKTTKTTLSGLGAKKYYYVRVRTYKKVGKTTYYSGWSTVKYVKTK